MTSSIKADLRITYTHSPRIMGFVYVSAALYLPNRPTPVSVFSWGVENGVLSRSQFVDTVVRLVRDQKPARVGFRSAEQRLESVPSEEFNYWSPETIRDIIAGNRTTADLLVV